MPKPTPGRVDARSPQSSVAAAFTAVLCATLLSLGLTFGPNAPAARAAHAVGPITLSSGQITDQVNALGGTKGQVQAAIDALYKARGVDLYVAYVKDFSGASPTAWADTTATNNGLGLNDVLLAVATNARQYAFSVENGFPISQASMDQVATIAVEPSLRTSNWAAAAIGATQGLAQASAGKPVTTPTFSNTIATATAPAAKSSSGKGALWVLLVVVLLAALVIGFLFVKRRKVQGGAGAGPAGLGRPSMKDLETEAAQLLIRTDDAIKTSEQELGFAIAQFGGESAAAFSTALEAAKTDLADAFRLRSKLDEDPNVLEAQRYHSLQQIIAKCKQANANLDAQTASFEDLRDLQNRTPEVLAQLETTLQGAPARINTAAATLQQASSRYSPQALEPVAQNPAQALQLVTFAKTAIAEGRQRLEAGEAGQAAVSTHSAQEAAGQVDLLTSSVDRRIADLDQASTGLAAVVAEVDGEIVEARGLLGGADPAAAQQLGGLEADAARIRGQATAGPSDPLALLAQLQAVDAQLDELLAGLRGERERQASAQAMLEQAMLAARSDVAAADDFITTRRGAIGSQARTLQAEALRQLDKAQRLQMQNDPSSALEAARQASNYARSAQQQANTDVRGFGAPGMGGAAAPGPSAAGGGAMGGLFGALIGGLVAESLSGASRGRGRAGPAPRSPGGFGGAPTRAANRRGSAGRF